MFVKACGIEPCNKLYDRSRTIKLLLMLDNLLNIKVRQVFEKSMTTRDLKTLAREIDGGMTFEKLQKLEHNS